MFQDTGRMHCQKLAHVKIVNRSFNAEGKLISIDLDELCVMESEKAYGIRVSTPMSPDVYYSIQTIPGESRTLMMAMPIPITSSISSLTLSTSAEGRSILLITGIISKFCSIAI